MVSTRPLCCRMDRGLLLLRADNGDGTERSDLGLPLLGDDGKAGIERSDTSEAGDLGLPGPGDGAPNVLARSLVVRRGLCRDWAKEMRRSGTRVLGGRGQGKAMMLSSSSWSATGKRLGLGGGGSGWNCTAGEMGYGGVKVLLCTVGGEVGSMKLAPALPPSASRPVGDSTYVNVETMKEVLQSSLEEMGLEEIGDSGSGIWMGGTFGLDRIGIAIND